jgi:putative transcriptional regulator
MSKKTITAKMRSDGTVVEVRTDGSERPFPDTPMRPMTEAEIEAAAAGDPDARPMTPEELRSARRVPRVKTLRRALRLTQEEFAARYHIPLGTLRDWEQGRCEPDQPARAYLRVIAQDPEGVSRIMRVSITKCPTVACPSTEVEAVSISGPEIVPIEPDILRYDYSGHCPLCHVPLAGCFWVKRDQTTAQARNSE